MKVWIVLENIPYETSDIVGVYSSKKAATDDRDERQRKAPRHMYYYSVEEWEVQ
jgi:hypothetical protein